MRFARRARVHETRGTDAERRRSEQGSSTMKCTARHQNAVPRCKRLVCPHSPRRLVGGLRGDQLPVRIA